MDKHHRTFLHRQRGIVYIITAIPAAVYTHHAKIPRNLNMTLSKYVLKPYNLYVQRSNFHYPRGITPKRVTSDGPIFAV